MFKKFSGVSLERIDYKVLSRWLLSSFESSPTPQSPRCCPLKYATAFDYRHWCSCNTRYVKEPNKHFIKQHYSLSINPWVSYCLYLNLMNLKAKHSPQCVTYSAKYNYLQIIEKPPLTHRCVGCDKHRFISVMLSSGENGSLNFSTSCIRHVRLDLIQCPFGTEALVARTQRAAAA